MFPKVPPRALEQIISQAIDLYGLSGDDVASALYILPDGRFIGNAETNRGHDDIVESDTLRSILRTKRIDLKDAGEKFRQYTGTAMFFIAGETAYIKFDAPLSDAQLDAIVSVANKNTYDVHLMGAEKDEVVPCCDIDKATLSEKIAALSKAKEAPNKGSVRT